MLSLAESGSGVLAPILAGALYGLIGLAGVMTIDVITFIAAILALLMVYIPQPKITAEGLASRGNIWKEALYGFRYIWQRKSLFGLQSVFFFINLTGTMGFVLLAPMVLARSANNELILGGVQSAGAIGGIVGGLALSIWGGPKRRVHGVLLGMMLEGILGATVIGLGRIAPIWAVGLFMSSFFIPILNGSNQAIWQAKVSPDLQGRVFATRRLIAQISAPVAMLLAGVLADRV